VLFCSTDWLAAIWTAFKADFVKIFLVTKQLSQIPAILIKAVLGLPNALIYKMNAVNSMCL